MNRERVLPSRYQRRRSQFRMRLNIHRASAAERTSSAAPAAQGATRQKRRMRRGSAAADGSASGLPGVDAGGGLPLGALPLGVGQAGEEAGQLIPLRRGEDEFVGRLEELADLADHLLLAVRTRCSAHRCSLGWPGAGLGSRFGGDGGRGGGRGSRLGGYGGRW